MRIAAVSRVETSIDLERASAEFQMVTPRLQAWSMIFLSLSGILALLAPVGMIAIEAVQNPQTITSISAHPGSALLLTAGLALGLVLLTYPLRAGLARLGGGAVVRVADGMVSVDRRGITGPECWSVPLAQFCGVTHHIRATLSGPRHEIILVHPDPAKDVLLHLAQRHPKEGADYYADLLGLAEIQPRMLYSRRRTAGPRTTTTELHAQAA